MRAIALSKDIINQIDEKIERCDFDGCTTKDSIEICTDKLTIFVEFFAYFKYIEEYEIHTEFAYNNVENLSRYEFDGAQITDISAYDEENEEEVEISNIDELKYN
ncbi:MAG: hypothetical protein ACI3ZD_11190 [Prevotella sp.]